jgi:hypothetical protein
LRIHLSHSDSVTRVEIVKCRGGQPGVVDVAGFVLDGAASQASSR